MGSYNYYKMFGCFNRKFKMSDTGPPPDVIEAFSVYSDGGSHLSADQMLRFLIDFQGEVGCTLSYAEQLMQQILHRRHHLTKHTRHHLTVDDFFYFLFQDDLNPPINLQVHQDMTAPLQHYFIYTGHNSYLTGNQLSSDCSDIPIINALERGVRGIELDLWPNSTKDDIQVLHGRTLTTPVSLGQCFKSIKQHAFTKSSYPVIVTLEDHLTTSLRAKVAEMAIHTFGELLYHPEPGCFDKFPSPEELKHHIILSTKPPKEYLESTKPVKEYLESTKPVKEYLESKNNTEKENTSVTEKVSGADLKEKETPSLTAELGTDQARFQSNSIKEDQHDEENSDSHNSSQQVAPEFKRLFAIPPNEIRIKPLDELAEGSGLDMQMSSQLSTPNEHAGVVSIDNKNSSQLLAPDEHAGVVNTDNKNSSQLLAPDELSEDPSIDNQKFDQFGTPDGLVEEPSLENHNFSQPEVPDERAEVGTLENGECSKVGTPDHKNTSAFQATNVRDAEDFAVHTRRSVEFETTERKPLGSLLNADEWSNDDEPEDDDDDDVSKFQMTASTYKRLIAIHAEKPKEGLRRTLLVESNKIRRLSLSEQELERGAESYGTDVVRFTQKNLVRVYPKGTRVTSSNFKPLKGWMVGAQMVAFNMQGYGKSLWLMHGMFRGNGGCGYVKKPDILMKKGPHEVFDPKKTLPVKKTLRVKVYLGDGWRLDFSHTHFDTYSPPDFYTKLYIVGAPADFGKSKTRIIEDDWTPVWDEEFSFPLTVPELALLRIEVREYDRSEKDDFGGQTCLPVSELRPGIRAVPLYDRKGGKYRSVRLLMRFQFV